MVSSLLAIYSNLILYFLISVVVIFNAIGSNLPICENSKLMLFYNEKFLNMHTIYLR